MACSETDGLLSKEQMDTDVKSKHLVLRLIGILSVFVLIYMAMNMQGYASREWIQHRIKVQMFGNETVQENSFSCTNQSNPDYAKLERVQQEAARWQMYMTIASSSIAVVTTFLYTVYSDVIGRRFVFILCCFSITLYYSLSSLVVLFNMDFIYLIIANVIYSLTGTSYGLLAVGYSSIADITTAGKERAISLFCMNISASIGDAFGALAAGYIIQSTGFVYPSFTAAAIALLGSLVAVFCIPESLKEKDKIIRPRLLESIKRPFALYFSKTFTGLRLVFGILLIAFIFSDMAGVHVSTTETLYLLGMPFCWPASKIGLFGTINTSVAVVLGIILLKGMKECMRPATIALISNVSTTGSFTLEAIASTDVMMYLTALPKCLSSVSSPFIRSLMSSLTSAQNQGALSAGILVVQNVCAFITGIIDNSVYAATLPFFNGFIFFVFAGYCTLSGIFLSVYILLKKRLDSELSANIINEEANTSSSIYTQSADDALVK